MHQEIFPPHTEDFLEKAILCTTDWLLLTIIKAIGWGLGQNFRNSLFPHIPLYFHILLHMEAQKLFTESRNLDPLQSVVEIWPSEVTMVMVIFAPNYQNYHFLHAVHVLELMGHPIGPKFGQYLQSIDIHVCIARGFSKCQNRPKIKISKVPSVQTWILIN